MMRRWQWVFLLLVGVLLLALFGAGRPTAVFSQAVSGEGEAHIYGNLQLDLTLSRSAGQPGDIIDLTITLTNHSQATETPTIPPTLATQLPDLEIGSYTVTYDDCPWGGPGTVAVSIDNFGVGDAGPFEVTINNDTTSLAGLGSLGEAEAAVSFAEGPVGSINAEVDSAQQVVEVDETNNSYTIVFTPPPPCATPAP